MSFIKQAYVKVLDEAKKPDHCFVTLYESVPFYGGPEEGGWWGHDCHLVESMHFNYEDDAMKVKAEVDVLAKELSEVQKRLYGERCLEELEWLEARGLDADFLPEPDGESKFFVVVESERGSLNKIESRVWE